MGFCNLEIIISYLLVTLLLRYFKGQLPYLSLRFESTAPSTPGKQDVGCIEEDLMGRAPRDVSKRGTSVADRVPGKASASN